MDTKVVHCQLSAMEQWQSVSQDVDTALVQPVGHGNVHVLNPDVRGDCSTSRDKHERCRLHCEPAPPKNLRRRTRHTVVVTGIEWTATLANTETRQDEARGSHNRRRRRTRNTCASKLDWRATGQLVKGTIAVGPLWERNRARRVGQPGPHCGLQELAIHKLSGSILPPVFRSGRVLVVNPTLPTEEHQPPHESTHAELLSMGSWCVVPQCTGPCQLGRLGADSAPSQSSHSQQRRHLRSEPSC